MVESTPKLIPLNTVPSEEPSHGGCSSCGSRKKIDGSSSCGNGLEKIYPTTAVRFGYMRFIGEFTHNPDMLFTCGAKVIIQTQRGQELGEQVSLTCSGCDKSVTRDQMKDWVKSSGEDTYMFNAGRILREATAADLAEFAHMQQGCRNKRDFARRMARRYNLGLKIVECECPLGGERIIFYFTAAERIDFRSMVKDLAQEYRTRIEMRQIGARDEARLLADFETCGREVCCKVFLKTLKPISMRMAKLQKATLDPSQVSGRCGRLKCCLRYEHQGYEELDKLLPRIGKLIETSHGDGVVINRQVLTQLVQIRLEDNSIATVVAEDIYKDGRPKAEKTAAPQEKKTSADEPGRSPGGTRRRSDRGRRPTNTAQGGAEKLQSSSAAAPSSGQGEGSKPTDERPKRRRRRRRRGGGGGRGGDGAKPQGGSPPPTP
jgi:cell fate regulator YaaT (PSP1 superfamily)